MTDTLDLIEVEAQEACVGQGVPVRKDHIRGADSRRAKDHTPHGATLPAPAGTLDPDIADWQEALVGPDPVVREGHEDGADSRRAREDAPLGAMALAPAGHPIHDPEPGARLFADPVIAELKELTGQWRGAIRAKNRLVLQAQAILRRYTKGDKKQAEKLYEAIVRAKNPRSRKRTEHPMMEKAGVTILPYLEAIAPLQAYADAKERELGEFALQLPIAHMLPSIKGLSAHGLGKIYGELGDLAAYDKGLPGVWKRAGLAVINGERQRRVSGDAALIHGYSPGRRSTFWNIAEPLLKWQGKGETAGPYRKAYDHCRATQAGRCETPLHEFNRAKRYMTKRLLRDLYREAVRLKKEADGA